MRQPPNYSFQDKVPYGQVISELANAKLKAAQTAQVEQATQNSRLDQTRQLVGDATSLVSNIVAGTKARHQREFIESVAKLMSTGGDKVQTSPGTPEIPGIPVPMINARDAVPAVPPTYAIRNQTPEYKNQMEKSLFRAFPQESAKQQLEQIYTEKTLNNQSSKWSPGKPFLVDGIPRIISAHQETGAIRDASTLENLNGHKIEPYVTPSSYGQVREKLGVQATLTNMATQIRTEISNSPSAKVVLAADNVKNAIDRVINGEVKPDKSVMAVIMSEVDRAVAAGVTSERRMEELMPRTWSGTLADLETKVLNNPTDRNVVAFLKNISKEVEAAGNQRRANVNNMIGVIMAQAKLVQRQDPEGFDDTVRRLGIEPGPARKGIIKFRPGSSSLFYGEGFTETGYPLNQSNGNELKSLFDELATSLNKGQQ